MENDIKLLVAKQCSAEGNALGEITGNSKSNIFRLNGYVSGFRPKAWSLMHDHLTWKYLIYYCLQSIPASNYFLIR